MSFQWLNKQCVRQQISEQSGLVVYGKERGSDSAAGTELEWGFVALAANQGIRKVGSCLGRSRTEL